MSIIADDQGTIGLASREASDLCCLRNAAASLLVFLAAGTLALNPDWISRPLARAVDSLAVNRPSIKPAWPIRPYKASS
jgi:hypothetical protein